ncbi:hypothetical protein GCM10022227_31700 [Streptomyces sedi]
MGEAPETAGAGHGVLHGQPQQLHLGGDLDAGQRPEANQIRSVIKQAKLRDMPVG